MSTEHKKTSDKKMKTSKLRKNEAKLQAILNNVADGIITINEKGIIESVNPATEKMFGYASYEMLGKNIKMLMPEPYQSEHDGYIQNYLRTGQAKVIGVGGREVKGLRKNGEIFPMELSKQAWDSNMTTEQLRRNREIFPMELSMGEGKIGDERFFVGIMRDITERKGMDENLRLQSTVMKAAANTIIISDQHGTIIWVNPAFTTMTGYTFEDAIGSTTRILNSGKHDASFYKNLWDTILSGNVWQGEMVNKRKDGSFYTEEMTITPVFNERNEIANFIAIKQDISERKEIDRMKNEFISMVSHELRTPLTSIRGALGLIAGGVAGELPAKVKSMIDIANKNSERLIRLINDILDIEKIESGKIEFQMKEIDLLPLIKQVMKSNRAYGEQLGVEFVLKSELENVKINGESDRLTQALTNLLSNAANYSPKNDKVVISVAKQDGAIRVSVTDRGVGIPEAFRSSIFGKFAQADSSDARQKGGSGLGLNITKAIVEKHGGKIAFTSKKGEGATFYFDLPERREETPVVLSEEKPEALLPRILVCEDSQVVAALFCDMLQQGGFATDIANNVAEARSLLSKNSYAAMTLDIILPDMDGISFVRELREQKQTRHLPIVMVSAKAEQAKNEITGGVLAVSDWINKPTDKGRLIKSLKHAVEVHTKEGKPRILHIEDDEDVRQIVGEILKDDADMSYAATLKESIMQLEQNTYDLVILDIGLPDGSGLNVLPLLNKKNPPVPVLVFSAQEITKDFAPDVSAVLVQSRASNEQLIHAIRMLIGKPKK